jgi:hypothetical protein
MIYEKQLELIQVDRMAPIKRPLSRENTSPSQKMMSFFAGSVSSLEDDPFGNLRPSFSNVIVWTFRRSATRHPSGSRPFKKRLKLAAA